MKRMRNDGRVHTPYPAHREFEDFLSGITAVRLRCFCGCFAYKSGEYAVVMRWYCSECAVFLWFLSVILRCSCGLLAVVLRYEYGSFAVFLRSSSPPEHIWNDLFLEYGCALCLNKMRSPKH